MSELEKVSNGRIEDRLGVFTNRTKEDGPWILTPKECCEIASALRELRELRRMNEWNDAIFLPEREGRYLVQYRQFNQTRIFVADYYLREGWANMIKDMEILKWKEIYPLPPAPEEAKNV